jgi:hypothetical protein
VKNDEEKPGFHKIEPGRLGIGSKKEFVLSNSDDPNQVEVSSEWDDFNISRANGDFDELCEQMKRRCFSIVNEFGSIDLPHSHHRLGLHFSV